MVDITKERVAEILREANPEKDWSDAEIEELTDIASDPAFPTEADLIYVLMNLPKVLRGSRTPVE